MNHKKYDRNGMYAAEVDFKTSKAYLLEAVVSGYEAVTISLAKGGFGCHGSQKWAIDYLETGLNLLGFEEVSRLVRNDFAKSASLFAESLREKSL